MIGGIADPIPFEAFVDETRRMIEPPVQREPLPGWEQQNTTTVVPGFTISATPFRWSDPTTFPQRQWLYGHHLIRKFISCTVAPGGIGKTSLELVEAVAMATGRSLLGVKVPTRLKVWVINLEDPREEIERRILAILIHYDIDPEEIDGQLFARASASKRHARGSTMPEASAVRSPWRGR